MDFFTYITNFENIYGIDSFIHCVDKLFEQSGQNFLNMIEDLNYYSDINGNTILWIPLLFPHISAKIIGL